MLRIVRTLVADASKRILLVRTAKRPGVWELPGGKVKRKGESDLAGAGRELEEETGIVMKTAIYLYQRIDRDSFDGVTTVAFAYTGFVALQYDDSHMINVPNHEIRDLRWFTLDEISSLVLEQNSRRLIIRWCRQRPPYCRPAHS